MKREINEEIASGFALAMTPPPSVIASRNEAISSSSAVIASRNEAISVTDEKIATVAAGDLAMTAQSLNV